MANERKEWEGLLITVNDWLKDQKWKIQIIEEEDGYYTVNIITNEGQLKEEYACNNLEEELCELINDAHHHILTSYHRSVWVFTRDMAWNNEILHNEIRVFDHREDAVKALKEWRDDEIKTDQEAGWIVDTDTDELFEAYEEGYYTGNHSVGEITEVTVE